MCIFYTTNAWFMHILHKSPLLPYFYCRMAIRNKIYFASDFHLGAPSYASSREREARLVRWLDMIKADAAEVFLMGDAFDFWFEYKTVLSQRLYPFFW